MHTFCITNYVLQLLFFTYNKNNDVYLIEVFFELGSYTYSNGWSSFESYSVSSDLF